MSIYDILNEARHGDIEKATKQFIEFMAEVIGEKIDSTLIINKIKESDGVYTEEELKRIAVVEFICDFIKNHKAEIESSYNLLPLTNDKDLMDDIKKIRREEIEKVNKEASKRPGSVIESETEKQASSLFDEELDKLIEDEKDDEEYLSVLKALDKNREGLKTSVSKIVAEKGKEGVGSYLSDTTLEEGSYAKQTSKVKITVEDVETQLESNPIWAKVTRKVPSDEMYELMGEVLTKKNTQTR